MSTFAPRMGYPDKIWSPVEPKALLRLKNGRSETQLQCSRPMIRVRITLTMLWTAFLSVLSSVD
jgi:hypothetical protein